MWVSLLQIYPDPESEKTVMGSVVYCIHHKEGCQWSDELRKLKVRYLSIVNMCWGVYLYCMGVQSIILYADTSCSTYFFICDTFSHVIDTCLYFPSWICLVSE